MVFQSYALYPHMTVRQNLGFGLKLRKTPKHEIDERVGECARAARPRRAARPQARRALGRPAPARRDGPRDRARAEGVPVRRAALEPRRQAAREHARPARARCTSASATTTLYVTHDQVEAMTLGHRVAVMRDGADPAGRHAAGALRAPGQSLRRRLHRLAGDEPRRSRVADGEVAFGGYAIPLPAERRRRSTGRVIVGHPAGGVRGRRLRRAVAAAHRRRRSRSSRSSAPTRTCCSPSPHRGSSRRGARRNRRRGRDARSSRGIALHRPRRPGYFSEARRAASACRRPVPLPLLRSGDRAPP